jgi:hypothetical protein
MTGSSVTGVTGETNLVSVLGWIFIVASYLLIVSSLLSHNHDIKKQSQAEI